ncbi:polysaccharide biosynthesis/export family protein [Rubinisphaera italica]|uniref:Polysaccharide biosynthesis/export protein n=1 Tax=Rubinisphaera italica TaxID=2527969 RepID=A0A5C5XDM8_9PLAN|nr:polysaccharide biosynthesis/export family protein [Rubinisphaera italica]TWT60884.1 Polysaccharide biosynthesis/export protein [Rubinisphaera italica]
MSTTSTKRLNHYRIRTFKLALAAYLLSICPGCATALRTAAITRSENTNFPSAALNPDHDAGSSQIQLISDEQFLGDLPLPGETPRPDSKMPVTPEVLPGPTIPFRSGVAEFQSKTAYLDSVNKYRIGPPDIIRVDFIINESISVSPLEFQGGIELLVRPDGTIGLGRYGSVLLEGLTVDEAAMAIEAKIYEYLQRVAKPGEEPKVPQVVVDILGFNSTQYYVIADNAGLGASVLEFPLTGSDTTLSALAQAEAAVAGRLALPQSSNKNQIWIVRTDCHGQQQILPVDWFGLTQCGDMTTNYKLASGDVLYINSDKLIRMDNHIAKVFSPINRVFTFVINGAAAVTSGGTSVITIQKASGGPN